MGRPSTRVLLFYQELVAVREAINLPALTEHFEALKRIEQRLIADERARLSNANSGETVEQSIELGRSLMALPTEQERLKACRLASALQKVKNPNPGLPKLGGWWGGPLPD